MKLCDRVYLVGSGKHGMELTHPMDCNVYLLDGGDECALIDAGSGVEPERIVAQIEAAGFSMSSVKKLLLTHMHGDHAAGALFFQQRYGMHVYASAEGAPWLEQADHERTSLNAAIGAGVYPEHFEFPSCPVSVRLNEGDRVQVGQLELEVWETPGHSRGHVSYMMMEDGQRSIFSGDVLFGGGKIVLQSIWDCSIQDYKATIEKLHRGGIERLFPGHSTCLLARADRHIQIAYDAFARLELPPNL